VLITSDSINSAGVGSSLSVLGLSAFIHKSRQPLGLTGLGRFAHLIIDSVNDPSQRVLVRSITQLDASVIQLSKPQGYGQTYLFSVFGGRREVVLHSVLPLCVVEFLVVRSLPPLVAQLVQTVLGGRSHCLLEGRDKGADAGVGDRLAIQFDYTKDSTSPASGTHETSIVTLAIVFVGAKVKFEVLVARLKDAGDTKDDFLLAVCQAGGSNSSAASTASAGGSATTTSTSGAATTVSAGAARGR